MLGWFADAPNPDAGLLGFRQISEALGRTHWYLQTLRDEGQVAQRLATVLASSRYATDLLQRAPEGVRMLGDDAGLQPLARIAVEKEMVAAAHRHSDPVEGITAIRGIRRRELFRIAVADLLGDLDVAEVGYALTDVTSATLEAALTAATAAVEVERGSPLPTRIAIVAMGRYGGAELGFGSDADVMFVHDPLDGASGEDASRAAHDVANELRRLLALPGTDPALEVDTGLRPEGKQGPLVRTLESYAAYYAKWSAVWEAQALLRAEPMVGDRGLRDRFATLIDPLRFPEAGITADDVREIRRIKARVDAERLPRGADPATHLKLGRGGLADVEWTVQLLQMQHAGGVPGLRTTRTLTALRAAVDAELLSESDADVLATAWRAASGLRNAITQVRGRAADSLPRDTRERAAVAHIRGYAPGKSDQMVNDYLRVTRRARQVVERLFWG
jgi:[glutamine synthetase] adenylyltransferase / [glutamine synthetase]-adenylyl-L-tyrosine phosphorylase